MKKRILMVTVATLLAVMLVAGCASPTSPAASTSTAATNESTPAAAEPTQSSASPAEPAQGATIKIGITIPYSIEFFTIAKNLTEEMASEFGIEVVGSFDANSDTQKQIEHMTTFASMGVDAIICIANDATTAAELQAAAGDIPVVFPYREPPADTLGGKYAYVGSNEIEAGKMMGLYVGNQFKAAGATEVNYIMLLGGAGDQNSNDRNTGVVQGLEEAGVTPVETYSAFANWARLEAMNTVQQLMADSSKKIDAIFGANDEMSVGAVEAYSAAGVAPADMPMIVGIDCTASGMEAMAQGAIAMDVFQDQVENARVSLQLCVDVVNGKTLESHYWIPWAEVTPENMADYM